MPHTTTWKNDELYWDIYGTIDSNEIMEFNQELSNHPDFDKLKYFIWDTTKVTGFTVDKDDANLASIFGTAISKYNKKIKGAFVAQNTYLIELTEEYIHNSRELNSPWELMIFDNVEDARKWVAE